MSHHRPTRPADRHGFDAIIDARSPAEFAEDHIPGAINCPVLDDAERATVGTLYAQQGAFEARRVGGAMVAANLARHLRQQFADKPQGWRPLIYCWRGGMRSGSMVQWLRLVGWDAQQLAGGYKAFRRHVIEQIAALVPRLDLRVLVGATGDLARRKLLPGLFHLCSAGFIPAWRIVGCSLDDMDAEGFGFLFFIEPSAQTGEKSFPVIRPYFPISFRFKVLDRFLSFDDQG